MALSVDWEVDAKYGMKIINMTSIDAHNSNQL